MFSGINIESSAACNLKCVVCPTTSYGRDVHRGYLKPEVLNLLLPFNGIALSNIDLTGWGEPLLNPHLREILQTIPGATFTTNATLLDERWAERVIKARVSAIAFSIDAARPETYVHLHGGGDCEQVWRNLKHLRRFRDEVGGTLPILSAHFLMMRSNIGELPEFVDRAVEAGMDEVVVKHVALFAKPAQISEALFTGFFENHQVDTAARDEIIAKAIERTKAGNIVLRRCGSDHAKRVSACFGGATERPFVAWDGRVSPCCVLAHRVARVSQDGKLTPGIEKFFGNLKDETLEEIWNHEEYILHRKSILEGGMPDACENCLGLWSVTVEPVT